MKIVKVTATVRPKEWPYNQPPEVDLLDLRVQVQDDNGQVHTKVEKFRQTDLESRFDQIWRHVGERLREGLLATEVRA